MLLLPPVFWQSLTEEKNKKPVLGGLVVCYPQLQSLMIFSLTDSPGTPWGLAFLMWFSILPCVIHGFKSTPGWRKGPSR